VNVQLSTATEMIVSILRIQHGCSRVSGPGDQKSSSRGRSNGLEARLIGTIMITFESDTIGSQSKESVKNAPTSPTSSRGAGLGHWMGLHRRCERWYACMFATHTRLCLNHSGRRNDHSEHSTEVFRCAFPQSLPHMECWLCVARDTPGCMLECHTICIL
jgi:hypothetical protein